MVCGDDSFPDERVFARLTELKVVSRGNHRGSFEQLRVTSPSGDTVKVRFWRLDGDRLKASLQSNADARPREESVDRDAEVRPAGLRETESEMVGWRSARGW